MLALRKTLHSAVLLALFASLLVTPALFAQEVPSLQINSERYIVIDADTGEIYAQRDADDRVAIASLTKVFTAVQALNMAPLDTVITTKASDLQSTEATVMGFGPGETYTLRDLIYGMLLPSGNDAAYAIARSLGYQEGDTDEEAVQRFLDLLNQRIVDMGLENTFLKNPDGWGVPGHYSSAADVAAFMQYASEYPFLVDVMGTASYTTSNGAITVTNTNKILNSYAPLLGGKTGYDNDSGWCLVNLAESGDTRMIAVTLDGVAPDDWYDDNMTLLEYGFEQKSSLRASGDAFNGERVSWNYPDAVELARVGEQRADVAGEAVTVSEVAPREPSSSTARSAPAVVHERFNDAPSAGPWLAGIAGLSLIGLSGAFRWRGSVASFASVVMSRSRRRPARLDTRGKGT
jgi:D-alanyl-D-alanine carboxypeptidase (penicillin-binding protein 5/6)